MSRCPAVITVAPATPAYSIRYDFQPSFFSMCDVFVFQACRSRKPKSRLESRLEEERESRARTPEPRIPIVSRPTAARTQHMAELAKTLSTRNSYDENIRLLVPHYPVSTRNLPVPRVLAEVIDKRAATKRLHEDAPRSSSRGSSNNGGEGVPRNSSGGGGGTRGTTAKQVLLGRMLSPTIGVMFV